MYMVNTNYDFGVDPDNDSDGTTTDVLDVPQEYLPPKSFDKEVDFLMVDNARTKETVFLATHQHQPPADPGIIYVLRSTRIQTKISRLVLSFYGN